MGAENKTDVRANRGTLSDQYRAMALLLERAANVARLVTCEGEIGNVESPACACAIGAMTVLTALGAPSPVDAGKDAASLLEASAVALRRAAERSLTL